MPWTPSDAEKHTHKAGTEHLKELWAKVANGALARGDPEAVAIRKANATVAREAGGQDHGRTGAGIGHRHRWL